MVVRWFAVACNLLFWGAGMFTLNRMYVPFYRDFCRFWMLALTGITVLNLVAIMRDRLREDSWLGLYLARKKAEERSRIAHLK